MHAYVIKDSELREESMKVICLELIRFPMPLGYRSLDHLDTFFCLVFYSDKLTKVILVDFTAGCFTSNAFGFLLSGIIDHFVSAPTRLHLAAHWTHSKSLGEISDTWDKACE